MADTTVNTEGRAPRRKQASRGNKWGKRILQWAVTAVVGVVCAVVTVELLAWVFFGNSTPEKKAQNSVNIALMDRYDMLMTNEISSALDGVLAIEKVYWLSDDDLVAPEPDQAKFGETANPAELQWLLDDAQKLLDGQDTLFKTDVQILPGSEVMYYLDETILAVTWKQVFSDVVYTISEVKIAHPSQFRRFLAGGEYGSQKQFITSEMAASVNAVVASSGDFYAFRRLGTIVYDGVVERINSSNMDTCFIDDQGDLILSRAGELTQMDETQRFVDENNIRFSLAFGPILVNDGVACPPGSYPVGEINRLFSRAVLCQAGPLHYYVITVNAEGGHDARQNVYTLANQLVELGVDKAYALDGGQTAAIVMNDELINAVDYGYQRRISDIIYFATAIPDGE